jgi:hypothetical protein
MSRAARPRAGDPRGSAARAPARPAPRAERGRAAVRLLRRARDGEQDDGCAHRLGADAQGRVPALQGCARLLAWSSGQPEAGVRAARAVHGLNEAGRFELDYGWLAGISIDEAVRSIDDLETRGLVGRRRHDRARISAVLAPRHLAGLPRGRRLADRRQRRTPAVAGREREGPVDTRQVRHADGRPAAQHGGLEHLAPPLQRTVPLPCTCGTGRGSTR